MDKINLMVEEKKKKEKRNKIIKLTLIFTALSLILTWFIASFVHNKPNNNEEIKSELVLKKSKLINDERLNTNIDIEIDDFDNNYFDRTSSGDWCYNFTDYSVFFLVPKFNNLPTSLSSYFATNDSFGYYMLFNHSTYRGELFFDYYNNLAYLDEIGNNPNVYTYFIDNTFCSLSNMLVTTDQDVVFTGLQVAFLNSYFKIFADNEPNSSQYKTLLSSILHEGNYYSVSNLIDYSITSFSTSINVRGEFLNGATFDRIYVEKETGIYVNAVLDDVTYNIVLGSTLHAPYDIFKLTFVTNTSYSNGLISLINLSFTEEYYYSFDSDYYYNLGYENGYQVGITDLQKQDIATNGFKTLFNAILNAPYNIYVNLLNFEFLGVNLFNLFSFIFTTSLILWVISILKK